MPYTYKVSKTFKNKKTKSFTYPLVQNGGSYFSTFYSYSFAVVDKTSSETARRAVPLR